MTASRICVETLRTDAGEVIPMNVGASSAGRMAFTQLEPVGVVVAVSAFNHPVNLIAHQIGPAIAAGCPVIISLDKAAVLLPERDRGDRDLTTVLTNNGKICNVTHMSAVLTISRLTKIYATPKGPAVIVRRACDRIEGRIDSSRRRTKMMLRRTILMPNRRDTRLPIYSMKLRNILIILWVLQL